MNDNIKDFGKDKIIAYPVQNEIYNRIRSVISEYEGEVGLAETLGVLRVVEHDLISDHE